MSLCDVLDILAQTSLPWCRFDSGRQLSSAGALAEKFLYVWKRFLSKHTVINYNCSCDSLLVLHLSLYWTQQIFLKFSTEFECWLYVLVILSLEQSLQLLQVVVGRSRLFRNALECARNSSLSNALLRDALFQEAGWAHTCGKSL